MKYILAHDLGTSGNKATLFSAEGELIASSVYSYDTHYFAGNRAEQDAGDWWKSLVDTTRHILSDTRIDPRDIACVSFSGQMMGCLCVDRDGRPLRPSIIWADMRAQAQQNAIAEKISLRDYYAIAGHRNSASYGLHKLMWVRDNEPDVYRATFKTLNAKDYLVYRLTGRFMTEPSDASSNGCVDLSTLSWSEKIVDISGIDPDKLPDILPSVHVAGGVTREAASETGLAFDTPVVLGGGDGVCANVGAGSVRPGRSFSYVGSSSWIATTSVKPVFDPEMRTVTWAHIVPGLYAPNGTMQSAGGSFSWLKNTICRYETEQASLTGVSPYDIIDGLIEHSPVGSNGVMFLPYLLGERAPRWDSDARGAFLGLRMENRREDILRSVLEGITLNLNVILNCLRAGVDIDDILVIGGGAKGKVWRQMMADIYGTTIRVPRLLEEATSMGAAVTGGVGTGLFRDFDVIDRFNEIVYTHTPDPASQARYEPLKELFEVCYTSLRPVNEKMKDIQEAQNAHK